LKTNKIFKSTGVLRSQKEPKSLPPNTLTGLKIYQKCFCGYSSAPDGARGAFSVIPDPLAGFGGPFCGGRQGGEKRRREEDGKDKETSGKT